MGLLGDGAQKWANVILPEIPTMTREPANRSKGTPCFFAHNFFLPQSTAGGATLMPAPKIFLVVPLATGDFPPQRLSSIINMACFRLDAMDLGLRLWVQVRVRADNENDFVIKARSCRKRALTLTPSRAGSPISPMPPMLTDPSPSVAPTAVHLIYL
jgi:hypothetical protein